MTDIENHMVLPFYTGTDPRSVRDYDSKPLHNAIVDAVMEGVDESFWDDSDYQASVAEAVRETICIVPEGGYAEAMARFNDALWKLANNHAQSRMTRATWIEDLEREYGL